MHQSSLYIHTINLRRGGMPLQNVLRDWSLIIGRGWGGYKTGGGGASEVLPLRKVGAEQVLAMLKAGHKTFWSSFYAVVFSHTDRGGGGAKSFHPVKRVINDQSLKSRENIP